jgi:hypothetical protein
METINTIIPTIHRPPPIFIKTEIDYLISLVSLKTQDKVENAAQNLVKIIKKNQRFPQLKLSSLIFHITFFHIMYDFS